MKKLAYILLVTSILSCNSEQTEDNTVNEIENTKTEVSETKETEFIIGERIDGPANIRNKPNGEILFELRDNALVEVATKSDNGWYKILIYADIDYNEYEMDSIQKGRPIILDNDTIGEILKSHDVSTGQGGDFAYAMLFGYTHENNIKPETVIENVFKKKLTKNGRNLSNWKEFIQTFKLDKDAIDYDKFETYYNYESSVEDPSPGFRLVLLFEKQNLIGLVHSREVQINNTITHKLNCCYFVTFFDDYAKEEQMKFFEYMNEWIQGVD